MPETTPIGPCVALQEALEACVKTNVCFVVKLIIWVISYDPDDMTDNISLIWHFLLNFIQGAEGCEAADKALKECLAANAK